MVIFSLISASTIYVASSRCRHLKTILLPSTWMVSRRDRIQKRHPHDREEQEGGRHECSGDGDAVGGRQRRGGAEPDHEADHGDVQQPVGGGTETCPSDPDL